MSKPKPRISNKIQSSGQPIAGDAAGVRTVEPMSSLEQAIIEALDGQGAPEAGLRGKLTLNSLPDTSGPLGRSSDGGPVVAFRPSRDTVQAIITAAAIIACADGQVSDLERRSLLQFLRCHGVLERNGRAKASAAFEQAVALAVKLGLDEACATADSFRALADRPGAPMVAHAATLVALADGVGWPQEIALLEIIRDRLGLRVGSRTETGELIH